MSENLGPGGFVILWMIQVGTWRETLGSGFWLQEVAPLDLVSSLFGRRQQKDAGRRGEHSHRTRVGCGAVRTQVRLPGFRGSGPQHEGPLGRSVPAS